MFEELPEVGDLDKPKLVFFFDEAHLLFSGASKSFLDAIQQTVRLIRSKGVGVFFVTQSPKDVPSDVLAQLGNRVQHALRAYTPDDAKALKAAVRTYPNTAYDLEELLTQLPTGEAVITVLSEKGAPTPVAWTRMRAPQSLMAPSDAALLTSTVAASPIAAKYVTYVERESASEMLGKAEVARTEAQQAAAVAAENAKVQAAAAAAAEKERLAAEAAAEKARVAAEKQAAKDAVAAQKAQEAADRKRAAEPSVVEAVVGSSAFKSALRSAGTVLGREITRSIFGTSRKR
jgi:DNA segregation ATPase FtsK/SpoIIIE-like protein